MVLRFIQYFALTVGVAMLASCAGTGASNGTRTIPDVVGEVPAQEIGVVAGMSLGEPLAVSLDYDGNPLVADGAPGRVLRIRKRGDAAVEFERPLQNPGFYPTDVDVDGFFVYALDRVGRVLVRFDKDGAYRGVLINFEDQFLGDRTTPVGLDVDNSGRLLVTDMKNHRVVLFDSYLVVELVFGSYGTTAGRLNAPEGVSFGSEGEIIVTDTGNQRVQIFDAVGKYLRMIPADGVDGPLVRPRRAVVDDGGYLYVADPDAGGVFVFGPRGDLVRTIVPVGASDFRPTDVAVSSSGDVYVTDRASSSLMVFR